jgi:hypothetical protein
MLTSVTISLDVLKDDVRSLIQRKKISRRNPIYTLCRYFPDREWHCIEFELEKNDYSLGDRIGDLLGSEQWDED